MNIYVYILSAVVWLQVSVYFFFLMFTFFVSFDHGKMTVNIA